MNKKHPKWMFELSSCHSNIKSHGKSFSDLSLFDQTSANGKCSCSRSLMPDSLLISHRALPSASSIRWSEIEIHVQIRFLLLFRRSFLFLRGREMKINILPETQSFTHSMCNISCVWFVSTSPFFFYFFPEKILIVWLSRKVCDLLPCSRGYFCIMEF